MIGAQPVSGLLRRREAPKVPLIAGDAETRNIETTDNEEAGVWILVWARKHVINSVIAQTSERREGRVKSGEVLDLIHILYRVLGFLSITILSRGCKVLIFGFQPLESRAK